MRYGGREGVKEKKKENKSKIDEQPTLTTQSSFFPSLHLSLPLSPPGGGC